MGESAPDFYGKMADLLRANVKVAKAERNHRTRNTMGLPQRETLQASSQPSFSHPTSTCGIYMWHIQVASLWHHCDITVTSLASVPQPIHHENCNVHRNCSRCKGNSCNEPRNVHPPAVLQPKIICHRGFLPPICCIHIEHLATCIRYMHLQV